MAHARVLCLADEGAKVGTPLIGSKGSSILFEVDGKRIMFGAGKVGRYLMHNMSTLQIKADSVDAVVIPTTSLDQVGGLNAFMTNRTVRVEVYSVPEVWDCKRTFGKLITDDNIGGIIKQEAGADWIQITEHLFISPIINEDTKELVMVLRTNLGPVVFSACAESGIDDSLRIVKKRFNIIRALVGGVRIGKVKQPAANAIADIIIKDYSINELHLNGCTGREGIQKMRVATSNDRIKDFFAGDELDYVL